MTGSNTDDGYLRELASQRREERAVKRAHQQRIIRDMQTSGYTTREMAARLRISTARVHDIIQELKERTL